MNNRAAAGSPHMHLGHGTSQVMQLVLLATVPGFTALFFCFGWGVLFNLLWVPACALACEAAVLKLRQRPPLPTLRDCSALLTGVLLAAALPPTAPWWLGLLGSMLAIVLAKQLYGGLGFNPFNPAMVGYAALLLAFPVEMTRWLLPRDVGDALPDFATALGLFLGRETLTPIDAYTGATALAVFREELGGQTVAELWQSSPVLGRWSGAGWEWVNGGFLLGGLFLLYRRVIGWQIPATLLGALALLSALFHDGGSSASHGPPLLHLFGGASMLGAFFIATDPVTAATSVRGRLVYGALIGSVTFCLRAFSSYPDGVAFAVLLGNFAAPFIDRCTQPRVQGQQQ